MDELIAALRKKGTASAVAHKLYPLSHETVRSWWSGKYQPERRSLAIIVAAYPDLADIVARALRETDPGTGTHGPEPT